MHTWQRGRWVWVGARVRWASVHGCSLACWLGGGGGVVAAVCVVAVVTGTVLKVQRHSTHCWPALAELTCCLTSMYHRRRRRFPRAWPCTCQSSCCAFCSSCTQVGGLGYSHKGGGRTAGGGWARVCVCPFVSLVQGLPIPSTPLLLTVLCLSHPCNSTATLLPRLAALQPASCTPTSSQTTCWSRWARAQVRRRWLTGAGGTQCADACAASCSYSCCVDGR